MPKFILPEEADPEPYPPAQLEQWEREAFDHEQREAERAVDRGEWYDDDGGIR